MFKKHCSSKIQAKAFRLQAFNCCRNLKKRSENLMPHPARNTSHRCELRSVNLDYTGRSRPLRFARKLCYSKPLQWLRRSVSRTTHIVMQPLELLEKIAAIIPRPKIHLTRFHGILGPNDKHAKSRGPPGRVFPDDDFSQMPSFDCE